MSHREFAITIQASYPGDAAALEKKIRTLVRRNGGTVNDVNVTPSASALIGLGIKLPLVRLLANAGIDTLDRLLSKTEADVLDVRGIGWRRYRSLVRALALRKLRLKDAPEIPDMIEQLMISEDLYLGLRSTHPEYRRWRADPDRTFRTVIEITQLDHVGIQQVAGYGADQVSRQLRLAGLFLAPTQTDRTVHDLLVYPRSDRHYFRTLVEAGLDPDTLLTAITREQLLDLDSAVKGGLAVRILLNHLEACGFIYGDDIRKEMHDRGEALAATTAV